MRRGAEVRRAGRQHRVVLPAPAPRARARASATRWPRRPTRCCAGACCSSTWRKAAAGRSSAGWRSWAGRATQRSCARRWHRTSRSGWSRCRPSTAARWPDKLRHNLPDWIAQPLQAQLGDEGFWPLVASLDEPAPLDLRVNVLKAKREDVQAALAAAGIEAVPTPYSPWGLRVQGKPALQQAAAVHRAARSRCRTRAASCWRC